MTLVHVVLMLLMNCLLLPHVPFADTFHSTAHLNVAFIRSPSTISTPTTILFFSFVPRLIGMVNHTLHICAVVRLSQIISASYSSVESCCHKNHLCVPLGCFYRLHRGIEVAGCMQKH